MHVNSERATQTLDDYSISALLSQLNTEARCVLLLATPDELTPASTIREDLSTRGAYKVEDKRRFEITGLLSTFHQGIITKINDPNDNSVWAKRTTIQQNTDSDNLNSSENPGVMLGRFAAGMAGHLLSFSLNNGIALRKIIGEKQLAKDSGFSATEIRLGALATIALLANGNDTFSGADFTDVTNGLGMPTPIARTQLKKLTNHGLLSRDDSCRPKIYRPVELQNGLKSTEVINDLLKIVAVYAIGSTSSELEGLELGRQILNDSYTLPRLIHRSYSSTEHTGKTFTKKFKS